MATLAAILALSALLDVAAGVWVGDPWDPRWWRDVGWPLSGVTWLVCGACVGWWVWRTRAR